MSKLNLKHLHYFWAVATHGTLARASQVLHLTSQTISGQLHELEGQVGTKLFEKSGRNLVLTAWAAWCSPMPTRCSASVPSWRTCWRAIAPMPP